jgi:hypothetical protein
LCSLIAATSESVNSTIFAGAATAATAAVVDDEVLGRFRNKVLAATTPRVELVNLLGRGIDTLVEKNSALGAASEFEDDVAAAATEIVGTSEEAAAGAATITAVVDIAGRLMFSDESLSSSSLKAIVFFYNIQ